jgi:hypothetical protein
MNRQFKELALQAGYPDYMTYGQDLVLERFAELIVRECARIVNDNDCEGSIVGDGMLFEHFGVAE